MKTPGKDLVWLHGEVKSPPFSAEARVEAGVLLRRLQSGDRLSMPHSLPMPTIGGGCHELRVRDRDKIWRIFYFIDSDAIAILEVAEKKTGETPQRILDTCKQRLTNYKAVRAAQ